MANVAQPVTVQDTRLLSRPFALAFVANFLTALSAHTYLHLPGFLHDLGARELRIGLIMGSMSAAGLLVRPALGNLMDRRGRRAPAVIGAVCMIAACLLYLTVHSLGPWIYVVRIIHGVAIAALFSSLFTIAADVAPPQKRAGAIALFGISGLIPLAIGGLLGDLILAHGSYQTLFLATAGTATLCLLAVLPIPDTRPQRSDNEAPNGFLDAIRAPELRPLWLIACGFALCVAASFTFLKTFVLETGVGSVGLFLSAYAAAAIGIRLTTSWLMNRTNHKRALLPALISTGAGLLVLAAASHPVMLAVSGVLCGLGHGYAFPTLAALVVDRANPSNRGAAITIFTALFDVGFLIGGPTFGLLVRVSSYAVMFTTAAAILAILAVVFYRWDRDR